MPLNDKRLKLALESSHMNIWEWNICTNSVWEYGHFEPVSYAAPNDECGSFDIFINAVFPLDRTFVINSLNNAVYNYSTYNIEFRAYITKGKTKSLEWLEAQGQVYYDEAGKPERMLGTAAIITRRKKLETTLRQHQLELAEVERSTYMGEMASILTHQLTQPLTSINMYITGCIQRLESKNCTMDTIIQIMKKIKENAILAGEIIHRVPQLTRNSIAISHHSNINELIHDTSLFFKSTYDHADILFNFSLSEKPTTVSIDSVLIQQLFYNLMRNAIEAISPAQQKQIIFHIFSSIENENTLIISIQNNGPVISKELRDKIFEPYFTTKPNGMGLGLSICRGIIESHGGQLKLKNTINDEVCFQFSLPIISTTEKII